MQIKCPKHTDNVASCHVYPNGIYCFAGCGFIREEELGFRVPKDGTPKYVEDLGKKLAYIDSLRVEKYRGFELPYDQKGHYIVWPDRSYYKLRQSDPKAKARYLGPAGHKASLFWARKGHSETLCIVEGEFEAMSVAAAIPDWDVVSPGGVSQFGNRQNLTHWIRYAKVIVATDDDAPGREAAMEIQGLLLNKVPELRLILKSVEKDFNDIFCEHGPENLKREIHREVQKM